MFYDLLHTLAFKHCDGVVDIQMAPAALDSTDAVSNQLRLKFNFHWIGNSYLKRFLIFIIIHAQFVINRTVPELSLFWDDTW